MGTVANILPFGNAAGPHYQLDYSTATSAGITTMSQATLASTNGVANIINPSPDGTCVRLRSDVDVDPIATNGYPRTEWRELATDGTTNRAFNGFTGDHGIEVMVQPRHLPPVKPSFVVVQDHDAVQDLLEIVVQRRSDYSTTGKLEVALKVAVGGSSSSTGLPRFIPDFGTLAELMTNPKWLHAKIRTGAIAPGGAAGWQCSVNGVFIQSWDDDIPTWDGINGSNSYYKTGMYLQTRWDGLPGGTPGVETDRNEYGEADWRYIRTYHNGEAAPWIPAIGTPTYDAVSNVRAGTKATGHRTAPDTAITLTPGLPASPSEKTMMLCLVRATRGINTSTAPVSPGYQSLPSSPGTPTGWTRLISTHTAAAESSTGAYAGGPQMAAHNIRWMLFAKHWESGDAAPTVSLASGTTLTDTLMAQIIGFDDARIATTIAELIDKLPAGLDAANPNDNSTTVSGVTYSASTSTTLLGPTGAITGAAPGSLAVAFVGHETNGTNATVAVVTGTDSPALTWAELGQFSLTTITPTPAVGASSSSEDEPAWAIDYAIIPGSAGQNIVAKTAAATISNDANKPNAPTGTAIPGKGWGLLFTIQPAQQRRRGHRAACTVG